MRAIREIGQEFGRIADQAGAFFKDAAGQFAAKVPGVGGKTADLTGDPIDAIRKLGELRDSGVLTDEEFQAKKTQLLERV